ncbi:MAG: 50S ribosome-binding GTPase [Candidatus Bathyarchaeota archaeon]|nr:50S ribosome-binding GTPase [Candidatus Bathyarchaeota archaeon]
MVTNLPMVAKLKWNEVTMTKNPETRLKLMGEFLSLVPKHKGTEKMCSQVKRQMSQIRDKIEKKRKQAKKIGGPSYYVQKAGAAQIAVVGPANAGRSSLLRAITNSQVEVTSWPFGTTMPTPGMLPYQDIQFQIVEIPPIVPGSSEGKAEGFLNLASARNADGLIIMVDLTDDPAGNLLMVLEELEISRVLTVEPSGEVEIQKRGHGRDIQFIWEGELQDCTTEEVTSLLNEYKIHSALVRIRGKVTLEVVEDSLFGNAVYRPTIVIANKADVVVDPGTIEQLKQAVGPRELMIISAEQTPNLPWIIGDKLFNKLSITRIYTKEPRKEPARIPIVAKGNVTVGQLAKMIHNDFYDRFKYARIWGPSAKFDNEKVGLDRELSDGTVIQIYT